MSSRDKTKNKIKQAIFLSPVFLFILFVTSCKKEEIENDLFLSPTQVTSYQFETYQGEVIPLGTEIEPLSNSTAFTFPITGTIDGESKSLYAAFLGNISTINNKPLILFCHDSKENLNFYYPQLKALYYALDSGSVNVLSFDYQGFGRSAGEAHLSSFPEDVELVMDWITNKGVDMDDLLVYGQGLGSNAALQLYNESNSTANNAKLILENPPASSRQLLADITQMNTPTSFLLETEFNNVDLIREAKSETLFFISSDDELIPSDKNADVLYEESAAIAREKVYVEKAQHFNFILNYGLENFQAKVGTFLN